MVLSTCHVDTEPANTNRDVSCTPVADIGAVIVQHNNGALCYCDNSLDRGDSPLTVSKF